MIEIIPAIAKQKLNDEQTIGWRPRPSNALAPCIREQVYKALNYTPQELAGRAGLVFDDSSWHEELTADWLRQSTYKLHSQQMAIDIPYYNSFLTAYTCKMCGKKISESILHGHIDGILTDLTGNDFLYEHKAINHFTFTTYEDGKKFPFQYFGQVALYLMGCDLITGKILPALLVIKNKNTSQYLEYEISLDADTDILHATLNRLDGGTLVPAVAEYFFENITKKIFAQWTEIENLALAKTLPPRAFDKDDYHCGYCGFSEVCWKNYDEELAKRGKIKIIDEEILKSLQFYHELCAERELKNLSVKDYDKQISEIEDKVKKFMLEKNAAIGTAGENIITLEKKVRSALNKKLIEPAIVAAATTKTTYEKIKIERIKEAAKNEKH